MTLDEAIAIMDSDKPDSTTEAEAWDVLDEAYHGDDEAARNRARPYIFYPEEHLEPAYEKALAALQDLVLLLNMQSYFPRDPLPSPKEAINAILDLVDEGFDG